MLNTSSRAVPTAAAYKANKSCTETLRLALLSPLPKQRYCGRTEKKKNTTTFFPLRWPSRCVYCPIRLLVFLCLRVFVG